MHVDSELPHARPSRIAAWVQHERHQRALWVVLDRLNDEKVPALPVKGIVTAHTLYPDLTERFLTDVDILVRPKDFLRLLDVGNQCGWGVVQRFRSYCNVVFAVHGVCVDVQCFPAGVPWLSGLTADQMVERAQASTLFGRPHLLADFDDHVVLLLLNAFKDKLIHTFVWSIADLERLPSAPQFDVARLAKRLIDAGAHTIGWIVADWLVRERGVQGWQALRSALGPVPPRRLYTSTLRRLRALQPRFALPLRVLSRWGADDGRHRMRAVGRMVGWQAEAWVSQWGDAPFQRRPPTSLRDTVYAHQHPGEHEQ